MSSIYSDSMFDKRNVSVTLAGIDSQYRGPIRILIEQVKQSAFLERHPGYLSLYDGISVLGWQSAQKDIGGTISFELRFTDRRFGLSLVFWAGFCGDNQTVSVYLHDRSGRLNRYGDSPFLDVGDYFKRNGIEFNATVSREIPAAEETARIISQCLAVLENDLCHFIDGWLMLAGTDLRNETVDDLSARLQALNDIDLADIEGQTLLCHAVRVARNDLVSYLLSQGANPNCGALYVAAAVTSHEDIAVALIEALIASGADVDNSDSLQPPWAEVLSDECSSPLFAAVRRGSIRIVRCLLRAGAKGKDSETFGDCSPAISQIIGASLGRNRLS